MPALAPGELPFIFVQRWPPIAMKVCGLMIEGYPASRGIIWKVFVFKLKTITSDVSISITASDAEIAWRLRW